MSDENRILMEMSFALCNIFLQEDRGPKVFSLQRFLTAAQM